MVYISSFFSSIKW